MLTGDMTTSRLLPRVNGVGAAAVIAGSARPGVSRDVPDPATGLAWDHVGWAAPKDVDDAVRAAASAMPGWAGDHADVRARALRAVAQDLRDNASALGRIIMRETGKRAAEALGEANFSAAYFEWFADAATMTQDWRLEHPDRRFVVAHRPAGVVAAVTPWNFPLSIPARKIAAALAAGCAVVLKPSELAPMSALALQSILDARCPEGLVNLVNGDGVGLTSALVDHQDVACVSFTGSTKVGALVAERAMRSMTRVTMELGGMAPFIVDAGADLDVAMDALLVAKFRNNGASCIAANNVYVHKDLHDEVLARLAARISTLDVGAPDLASTELGPLQRPEHVARLRRLVRAAEARGARTWSAPVPDTGWYCPPTLVAASTNDELWNQELFGPVCAVRSFQDVGEVVHEVNARRTGLAGYVVSASTERSVAVASRLNVGIVGINTGAPNTPEVPFGGFGMAGMGREGGVAGMMEFLESQTISVAR